MSLKLVNLAAAIEDSDDFHLARLLLLLKAAAGRSRKPVQGIMKLAKLDFLLRYPNCLARALVALGQQESAAAIPEVDRNTIETRMIRFRFGPWDSRYRRWIALLVAKGLAETYLERKTVNVKLTDPGMAVAEDLAGRDDFESLATRSRIIVAAVGAFSPTKLKDFVYEVFPEIVDMRWGRHINI